MSVNLFCWWCHGYIIAVLILIYWFRFIVDVFWIVRGHFWRITRGFSSVRMLVISTIFRLFCYIFIISPRFCLIILHCYLLGCWSHLLIFILTLRHWLDRNFFCWVDVKVICFLEIVFIKHFWTQEVQRKEFWFIVINDDFSFLLIFYLQGLILLFVKVQLLSLLLFIGCSRIRLNQVQVFLSILISPWVVFRNSQLFFQVLHGYVSFFKIMCYFVLIFACCEHPSRLLFWFMRFWVELYSLLLILVLNIFIQVDVWVATYHFSVHL